MSETAKNQSPPDFVHLHVHTEYSLIDGTIRTSELIERAKSWGQKAVAMTDSGNLFGAVEFYTKAKAAGLKAIIGSEIYFEGFKPTLQWAQSQKHTWPKIGCFHLLLLCRNNLGYKNLCKIVSLGYTDGLKDVPVVKLSHLERNKGDMIALSGDMRSELSYLVQEVRRTFDAKNPEKTPLSFDLSQDCPAFLSLINAIKCHINGVHEIVGLGNYYVELIDNRLHGQKQHLEDLASIAKYFDLPLVCSADAHYLDKKFMDSHSVFVAIKAGITFKELRSRNKQARFHLLSPKEVQEVYGTWPEAIQNTVKIADCCDVTFEFGKYYLPKFPVPDGYEEGDYLAKISKEMLETRLAYLSKIYGPSFDEAKKETYRERLNYEVKVIQNMGFPGYFLIVQDFINWAKSQNIPVGPGRGSGAGSLVAYSLRITDLDPLRFNLLFERFLNPERISMPDFDVDFCQDRRGEVLDYVTQKYGKENVAQIATFGKMKAKLAVRDVGRVMELSYGRVDKIAKLIPAKVKNDHGEDVEATIELALKSEPKLQAEAERDSVVADILRITSDLEGLNRQTGLHAAGVVMSDGPMTNYLPVMTNEDGALITQFEMKNAEKVGLVKFDFLGLKTLTVLQRAVELIHKYADPNFDINAIDLEDKSVYRNISTAHTIGVFQLEGEGMMQLVKKLQPSCFEDIIALVALFRPGPLGSGMVDDFVERKHGRQAISYPLPQLQEILKETYGVILYQEQVQKTAVALANYSPGEADLLRRAMGKKDKSVMAEQKARFLKGAQENNLPTEKAAEIFDLMAKFAEYGFNKSHSAAYGLVSYQTAYLKTHFRDLYMAAIMSCDLDDTDKVVRYADDCRRMGIKILPPDINYSDLVFTVPAPGAIRWGLTAIKGIGAPALVTLVAERSKNGIFKNLADLAKRVNLHAETGKKTLELLIKCGAFDSFGLSRVHMLQIIGEIVKYSESRHSHEKRGIKSLFDFAPVDSDASLEDHDIPAQWLGNPQTTYTQSLESLEEERKLMGIYMTGHPMDFYAHDAKRFGKSTLAGAFDLAGKGPFTIVAILQGTNERITKTGTRLCYIALEDRTSRLEAVMSEKDIPSAFPVPGTPVVVQAKISKLPDGTISSRIKLLRVISLEEIRQNSVKKLTVSFDVRAGATKSPLTEKNRRVNLDVDAAASLMLKQQINRLKEAIGPRKGHTELHLEVIYPGSTVNLKVDHGIELTDKLVRTIKTLSHADVLCLGRYG
jgi:DNA polymerase-3 subunit alpha